MTNTITNTTLMANARSLIYFTLASDGSNETGTVLYDSDVINASAGLPDSLFSHIEKIYAVVSTATTARVKLLWGATTSVLAFNLPAGTAQTMVDFRKEFPIGGLPNQGGSGITGDILITTTGLASGDSITIILQVKP